MKTKKTIITVLAVVLVISAALIVSCIDLLEEVSGKPKVTETAGAPKVAEDFEAPVIDSNFIIPEGKGVVRFKISDKNMRTIMPDPASNPLSAMLFTIQFDHKTDDSKDHSLPADIVNDTKLAISAVNTSIALAPGDYDITITAYDPVSEIPIATWSNPTTSPVSIVATQTTPISANLVGIIDGVDTGKFSYDITLPANGIGVFTAENYSSHVSTPIALTQSVQNEDEVDLPSGSYIVTLTVSATNYQTRQYVRVLHIYPEMTSTVLTINVPALVKNRFQIDFDLDSVSVSNTAGTFDQQNIVYANHVTIEDPVPTGADSGKSFVAWYKEDSFTNVWNLSSERVFNDATLYAKFAAPGATGNVQFTISFTINDAMSGLVSNGTGAIYKGSFSGEDTVTITLADPSTGHWEGITWTVQDIPASTLASHYGSGGTDPKVLIINNSQDFYGLLSGPDGDSFEVSVTANLVDSTDKPNREYGGEYDIIVHTGPRP